MRRWSPEELAPAAPRDPARGAATGRGGGHAGPGAAAAPAVPFRPEYAGRGGRGLLEALSAGERATLREALGAEIGEAARREDARRAAELRELGENLASALEAESRALLESVARAGADLALAVAERIVRREVAADPGVLARAIESVLLRLRAGVTLTVTVSPDDARYLEGEPELCRRLGIAAIQPDRRLARGGCVVSADRREWDATLAGQLEALGDAIAAALADNGGGGGDGALPALG